MTELSNLIFIIQMCAQLAQMSVLHPSEAFRCTQTVTHTVQYHFDGDFTSVDDANLIGFLRDGFPIYGRKDADGSYPSNLDSNGGHVGTTAEFSTAIYHYHTANTAYMNSRFYVLKSGSYHGTKGTFAN